MTLATRLSRYAAFAHFLTKYGRTAFTSSGNAVTGDTAANTTDAAEFAQDLEQLGPTFIKLGQLLSTRADLLAQPYVDALERLQDNVAPFSFEEAEAIVSESLGVRVSKAFREFERAPIAAASLGQVHRAVLRSGRVVAVKVQRPQIRERVLEDLEALDEAAALLETFTTVRRSIDVPRVLEEFRRTLLRELDYRHEARSMRAIHDALADIPNIVVPVPVDDYTADRVLTMDYVEGTKVTKVSPLDWLEVDGRALAHDLFRAYLQQILVDGLFHADPHPGNVLLTSDHRLALVDLGMVGRLSGPLQDQLFRLMLAIADGRGDDAGRVVSSMGEKLDDFQPEALQRVVNDLVGQANGETADSLNVGRVMLDLTRTAGQFGLRMPPELALLGKTLLNLHEIGRILDPDFDVNGAMRDHAARIMQRRALRSLTPSRLFASAVEVREFAERVPGQVSRILEALSANQLRVNVELIDHGAIIDGLQKVANRIALGLVLAALILGAALLMQVPTSFTILGYPGLAMVLFLGAAAGGLYMAWTILASDVRQSRGRKGVRG
jgi:predicted unusual protein kinase regulating ubiquinone biosynthesis (AarF/ABC1/UbiB family)